MFRVALITLLLPISAGAAGQTPMEVLKRRVDQPTEIMVLATPHLSGVKGVTPRHLDELHAALQRYRPQVIAIEAIPSQQIEVMLARPADYGEVLEQFVGRSFVELARASQQILALSAEQARVQLSRCEPLPLGDAKALSHCLQLSAAAYDMAWFNYIGWQYGRRHAGVPLDGAIGKEVSRIAGSTNENFLIAARLAEVMGLSRLYAMDDQEGKDLYGPVYEALVPSIEKSKRAKEFFNSSKMIRHSQRLEREGLSAQNLMPLYRFFNSDEYGRLVVNDEWGQFVDGDLVKRPALSRLAMWDRRNLAMVSNVLGVATSYAGERMLVVVGASHKVFFDDYLDRSIGVKVRQLHEVDGVAAMADAPTPAASPQ